MAEGILRRKLLDAGLLGPVAVFSAGTEASALGRHADGRARATMRRHGDSIRDLRVTRFSVEDFERHDLILAMDEHNLRELHSLASSAEQHRRIRLFRDFGDGGEVQDPVELGRAEFEETYAVIDQASESIVRHLETTLAAPKGEK
jgi:protein-tyrosine phosphatase